jgi:hypothetical protein
MITTEESKDITVNGVRVTCYSDGSVYSHGLWGRDRSFGSTNGDGYMQKNVNLKKFKVHDLIAGAFLGEKPENYDVDHINGNRADNRPSNLRYVTRSENLRGYQKVRGKCQYRGVFQPTGRKNFRVTINNIVDGGITKRYELGYFDSEKEAAIARDTFCFEELGYPLEGLNFPELFVDKKEDSVQISSMQNTEENIERVQTQIDMIRQESRLLSYRIDRMTEQRKSLQEEKRKLKDFLTQARKP